MNFDDISIEWIMHDCFKFKASKVIYIDPFQVPDGLETADYILVSHEHFDHCNPEAISKLADENTTIITIKACEEKLQDLNFKEIIIVAPNNSYDFDGFSLETIPAYNTHRFRSPDVPFHPKESGMVGFVLHLGGKRIYHSGDVDKIPEMGDLKNIDIALVPVSGKYVMDAKEAVEAIKLINPKIAIPMHYGTDIVGTIDDAKEFKELVGDFCRVEIL